MLIPINSNHSFVTPGLDYYFEVQKMNEISQETIFQNLDVINDISFDKENNLIVLSIADCSDIDNKIVLDFELWKEYKLSEYFGITDEIIKKWISLKLLDTDA